MAWLRLQLLRNRSFFCCVRSKKRVCEVLRENRLLLMSLSGIAAKDKHWKPWIIYVLENEPVYLR